MMNRLVPNIFYEHLADGLELFVAGLGFSVLHQDKDLAVIQRDGAKTYLVESAEFAAKDRPQIAIETYTIDDIFQEVSTRAPHLLHPNARQVDLKPWGFREFAVRDKTDVCGSARGLTRRHPSAVRQCPRVPRNPLPDTAGKTPVTPGRHAPSSNGHTAPSRPDRSPRYVSRSR
jgi:hypothetical protein